MRVVIVYESMFGNTHAIADAVGKGLEPTLEVVVVPLVEAGRERRAMPTCSWWAARPISAA